MLASREAMPFVALSESERRPFSFLDKLGVKTVLTMRQVLCFNWLMLIKKKNAIAERKRCPWVPKGDGLYEKYHDKEWCVPIRSDKKLFEYLVLESAQAGLSWKIILSKRENYRKAFANFDPAKVASFGKKKVARLLQNSGIIRNRAKVEAAVNNARRFLEVQKEFGSFRKYQWRFTKNRVIPHKIKTIKDYPKTIPEAEKFAADLKKRGFKFLGPTVVYAHMQAVGMVNDHSMNCFRRGEIMGK